MQKNDSSNLKHTKMKTIIMTNLVILLMITFGLSCSKNDSPLDKDNNLDSDSTNVEDSSNLNQDTLCMYQNIVLDTNSVNNIEYNSLIGSWKLIIYADLIECSFITKPDEINKSVEINFLDSLNVTGNSLANDISGKYKLISDSIKFVDLKTTLVLEPDWGADFITALYNTDLVTIKNDTLLIYYFQSQKIMIFSKNQ